MAQPDNLLGKLTRFHIEERQFVPDGQTQPISYNAAILSYQLNGNDRTMALKISADKAQILELADNIDTDLLG